MAKRVLALGFPTAALLLVFGAACASTTPAPEGDLPGDRGGATVADARSDAPSSDARPEGGKDAGDAGEAGASVDGG